MDKREAMRRKKKARHTARKALILAKAGRPSPAIQVTLHDVSDGEAEAIIERMSAEFDVSVIAGKRE